MKRTVKNENITISSKKTNKNKYTYTQKTTTTTYENTHRIIYIRTGMLTTWGLGVNKLRLSHPLLCPPPERHVTDHTGFSRTGLPVEMWIVGDRSPREARRALAVTGEPAGIPERSPGNRLWSARRARTSPLESLLCSGCFCLFATFPPWMELMNNQMRKNPDSSGHLFCPFDNASPSQTCDFCDYWG